MSLIISVERFGAEKRFLRLHGLLGSVGLDSQGVLTTLNPEQLLFSVFSIGSRFGCFVKESGFQYQGKGLSQNDSFWIEDGSKLQGLDFTFKFHPTSTSSEVLAAGQIKFEEIGSKSFNTEVVPWVHLKVANLESKYPLFPGIPLSVGSSNSCLIPIKLDGIEAKHLRLLSNANSLCQVIKESGQITVNGLQVVKDIEISETSEIALQPTGIMLKVIFP